MSLTPLSAAPWSKGDADDIVAVSTTASRRRAALLDAVARWAGAALPAGEVALFEPDPWRFVTALLGLWHAGRRVWLPGDNLPATRAALAGQGVTLLDGTLATTTAPALPVTALAAQQPAVVLFTSGSSGTPTPIQRTLSQLDGEVHAFYRHWPLGPGAVISQVSHQHTWGLTAGLLRALVENRPFGLETLSWPEQLDASLARLSVSAVISAPPQLSRLPNTPSGPGERRPQRIFSAAAALSPATARDVEARFGAPVVEIFGSSECGALGFRQPARETLWTPLDDVSLTAHAAGARLVSPRCVDDNGAAADRIALVEATPQRFRLLGRADRIVKIGARRVSLEGMARHLECAPGVNAAHCLALDHAGGRIGTLVALDEERLPAHHEARRALIAALREHLSATFEAVTLPRFWRFVTRLPRNTQGKLTHAAARALFDDLDDRRQPRWLGTEQLGANDWRLTLEIPERLASLAGHFPARPMVPGIVLIQWARQRAEALFDNPGGWRDLHRVRFPAALLPGDRATLTLGRSANRRLAVRLFSHRGDHLQMTLLPAGDVS
ncbi:AMP-binding protein [Kushneria aurantia]|uniref:AMP-binding protein n=1 Tax=Kushneria aurantia TaxID=504092 RepID=A0ABV6FZE5_9GAMM|nr:AMP-binding protein [Kushneria aurantia]